MNWKSQISVDVLLSLVFIIGVAGCSKSTDSNVPIDEPLQERIEVSGSIAEDTVWEHGKEYYVTGDVIVETGATLTIQPNVVVKFRHERADEVVGITVEGTLMADGGNSTACIDRVQQYLI